MRFLLRKLVAYGKVLAMKATQQAHMRLSELVGHIPEPDWTSYRSVNLYLVEASARQQRIAPDWDSTDLAAVAASAEVLRHMDAIRSAIRRLDTRS